MNCNIKLMLLLTVAIVMLFFANIAIGSVDIPLREVCSILTGAGSQNDVWQFIVLGSRLPQAVTAVLCGAALAVSGLLLQTAFRNPLAGPSVFGINGGAGLGVALVMLAFGGSVTAGTVSVSGFLAVFLAAFAGAMAVTAFIFFLSTLVRSSVMLLIAGIMTGYLASSLVTLLNFFATDGGVKSYIVWGMGSFGGVSLAHLPLFALVTVAGLIAAFMLVKPLNALMLGEEYASNLGFSIVKVRNMLLVVTGVLTAVTTAFCGPVAFLGLAVPHVARLLLSSGNHRVLLPVTMLCGASIALLCNLLCSFPSSGIVIPLNAVTPLVGAPVILYVLIKRS